MSEQNMDNIFNVAGKVAVVTGGGGVLCGAMCRALGQAGAKVAVLDLSLEAAQSVAREVREAGGEAIAVACDVLDLESIDKARQTVLDEYDVVDILINGAGGNKPQATTSAEMSFFDLPADAVQWVFNLNFMGTLLPSQVFGKPMVGRGAGTILNVSSMNAFRPLTRIPAYSAAKAAVSNFTQWLATHIAQEYSPAIRVNAIAPGFFLTEQNKHLLTEVESGELTSRGHQIITHTPMGRFGTPEDLLGTMFWLLSPASSFITGVVVPIDGGFQAFSGV